MHNFPHLSLHQMESAISLRYCPFPYGSKGFQFQVASPSRIHLKFNHATPFCLPQISTTSTHHVTRSFRHANCMLERVSVPSKNEGKNFNKILRGVKAVSLVLACALGLFSFSAKLNPKFTTAYAIDFFPRPGKPEFSKDISMVNGTGDGMSVLKSLYKIMKDSEPPNYENQNPTGVISQNEVNILKKRAIGKRDYKALNELTENYKICKNNPEAKDYTGMALVEVYMFQGNFMEALDLLNQQINENFEPDQHGKKPTTPKEIRKEMVKAYKDENQPSVAKFGIAKQILYKAIVHTMLGEEEANEWWEAFRETLSGLKLKR